MLPMAWWDHKILCPKCNELATLVEFNFSADGELRLYYICQNQEHQKALQAQEQE